MLDSAHVAGCGTMKARQGASGRAYLGMLKNWFLDALYPPDAVCFACDREAELDERYLCADCAPKIITMENLPCPAGLNGVSAGLLYNEAIQHCIYRLKYGDAKYIARPLARLMRLPEGCMPDYLVPVPLYPQRLKDRGYNQSELLARAFSEHTGITVQPFVLARTRQTVPQASLKKEERAGNVLGAFQATVDLRNKTILLIDDVLTTGSTLTACADALRDAGAKAVYATCACAAPYR